MTAVTVVPPGAKWIWILGISWFGTGFIGPVLFDPDTNLGPLLGLLYSGPAGFALGAMLWGICTLFNVPTHVQWVTLKSIAAIGVLVTLYYAQPKPTYVGSVFVGHVESCARPAALESAILDHWSGRIAMHPRVSPRTGWKDDMQQLLRDAPGVVIAVRFERARHIKAHRKLWNRGEEFVGESALPREAAVSFYDADGHCSDYAVGSTIRGFQRSDYKERMARRDIWPPSDLLGVLRASKLHPVPEKFRDLRV